MGYTLLIYVENYDEDFTFVQRDQGSRIPDGRTLVYFGETPLDAFNKFALDVNVARWGTGEQYSESFNRDNPSSKVTIFANLFFQELRNYMTDHARAVATNNIPFYYKAAPGDWDFLFTGARLNKDLTFAFEYKGNYDLISIKCEKVK